MSQRQPRYRGSTADSNLVVAENLIRSSIIKIWEGTEPLNQERRGDIFNPHRPAN